MVGPAGTALAQPGRVLGWLLLCVMGLACPRDASAQFQRRGPDEQPGRYRLGPLYVTPKLELRNAGVDTNVYYTRTGAVPDRSIVIRPSAEAVLPLGRRLRFSGDGYLDVNQYRRSRSESSNDFAGHGRGELYFGRMTLFGEGGGSQIRQRQWLDIDQRVLRQEAWANAGVQIKLMRRIDVIGSAAKHQFRYGSDSVGSVRVNQSLDRDERTAQVEVRWDASSRTALTVQGDITEYRFLHAALGDSRIGRSLRYMGGFEFSGRGLFEGRLLAGVRDFPGGSSGALPPYRGPTVSANLSFPLARFAEVSLQGDRDVWVALAPVRLGGRTIRNTYARTLWGGGLVFGLPLRLLGRASATTERGRYILSDGGPRRVDLVYHARCALLRAVGKSLRIGVAGSWIRRVSSDATGSFEAFSYGLTAELVP